jgi:aspartokinase/homoserine dehydrogenase 1
MSALPACIPCSSPKRIDIVLIGARGRVGSAFRARLAERSEILRASLGIDLRLRAAYDRRGLAESEHGLDPIGVDALLAPRREGDVSQLWNRLGQACGTVAVDCTASDEVAADYPSLLGRGIAIAAANKHAGARPLGFYRDLQAQAQRTPWRYETTVGAAIPVLGPLRDLRLRGERVLGIRGLLSGSLSYLLSRLHEGVAFSVAVIEARDLGYTEPDPLEDLGGQDVARKLLILGREAGFELEPAQITVQPLTEARGVQGEALLRALEADDAIWRTRISDAQERGERLVVVGEVDASGGRVGVASLRADDVLASARPRENVLEIRTDLQQQPPLTLRGPGAGADVTAAGVFSDVLAAAQVLAQG